MLIIPVDLASLENDLPTHSVDLLFGASLVVQLVKNPPAMNETPFHRSVHQALKRGILDGVLLCSSVHQAFDQPASLLFNC